jgi:hypothetical protein
MAMVLGAVIGLQVQRCPRSAGHGTFAQLESFISWLISPEIKIIVPQRLPRITAGQFLIIFFDFKKIKEVPAPQRFPHRPPIRLFLVLPTGARPRHAQQVQ